LFTPSLELGILAGVTRAAVLEAAPRAGFEVHEGEYTLSRLLDAEEVFTTSSVREVMPAVRVDDCSFERGAAAQALQLELRKMAS
jgi:branched-subunit amino acid aminotransferase/4-amino-4-deoxychorismate lyase